MPQEELISFVREQMSKGTGKEDIRRALLSIGAASAEVESIIEAAQAQKKNFNTILDEKTAAPRTSETDFFQKPPSQRPAEKRFSKLRKFLWPAIILLILAAVAGASLFIYQTAHKIEAIKLLPEDTAFYLKLKINPQDPQIQNLRAVLNRFPNYDKLHQKILEFVNEAKLEEPSLAKFDLTFVKEIIIAWTGPLNLEEIAGDTESGAYHLTFILPDPDLEKLQEFIKDTQESVKEKSDWKLEEEIYKGTKIYRVIPPENQKPLGDLGGKKTFGSSASGIGMQFCFAKAASHLAFTTDIDDMKNIIDLVDAQKITNAFRQNKKKSIADAPAHQKIQKYLSQSDYLAFFYGSFDLGGLTEQADKAVKTLGADYFGTLPLGAGLKDIFGNLPFLSGKEISQFEKKITLGGFLSVDNEGFKDEICIYDARQDAAMPAQFSLAEGLANMIPAKIGDLEIMSYSESRDLKQKFEDLEREMLQEMTSDEQQSYEETFKAVKNFIGLDVKEDILPLFRQNYASLMAADPKGKNAPLLALVSEVKDEETAKEELSRLTLPKFSLEDFLGLSASREKAKDARAIADIVQLRTWAEIIYSDEGGYQNFSCSYKKESDLKNLCDDIKSQTGSYPTIHSSKNDYCLFAKLNQPETYYCVNWDGKWVQTSINPSAKGYCTGSTFVCPSQKSSIPGGSSSVLPSGLQNMAVFSKETAEGIEVYSMPLYNQIGLFFTVKDKKLVLGLTKQSVINIAKNLKGSQQKLADLEILSVQLKGAPQNITAISYTYPYAFVGVLKYLVKISSSAIKDIYGEFMGLGMSDLLDPMMFSAITEAANELIDKGIAPYLKVLETAGSYSFAPENGVEVIRGWIVVSELSAAEKRLAEKFWENIDQWMEDKLGSLMF